MPTTTIRPNGSASFIGTGGTVTGAANGWTATSDDTDASYVALVSSKNSFGDIQQDGTAYALGTFSLPAASRTRTIVVRGRIQNMSGWASYISLFVGGFSFDLGAAPVSATTVSAAAVAVGALTQTQIDALTIAVSDSIASGAPPSTSSTTRVYELYVDVAYALQPTTAVSAPSGSVTTTTQPTVTWAHTAGTDGGPQSAFELAIFSAAEYGVAGFNPATSPATYRSGTTTGSTSSLVSPVQLANSTSYRAYVRTAQTINGVLHWADWAFSAFSISITAPNVPTLTATADTPNGRVKIAVADTSAAVDLTYFEVARSTDTGLSWTTVRGDVAAGYIAVVGQARTIYDYETPPSTGTIYRARAIKVDGTGNLLVSAWSTSTSSVQWTTTDLWLKSPTEPTLSTMFRLQMIPALDRDNGSSVFWPSGRATPIVASGIRRSATGTLLFDTMNTTERAALDALLDRNETLLMHGPGVWDVTSTYIRILRETRERVADWMSNAYRHEQYSFVEVAAPSLQHIAGGYGATWDELDAAYTTWTALDAAFATWDDQTGALV